MSESERPNPAQTQRADVEKLIASDAAKALEKAREGIQADSADEPVAEERPAVEAPKPEATTPQGTAEATKAPVVQDSNAKVTSGLDSIPEEYREIVAAAIRKGEGEIKSSVTKKLQEAAKQKEETQPFI